MALVQLDLFEQVLNYNLVVQALVHFGLFEQVLSYKLVVPVLVQLDFVGRVLDRVTVVVLVVLAQVFVTFSESVIDEQVLVVLLGLLSLVFDHQLLF